MSIKKTNQVVYVEPNADENLKTAYSTSVGTVMKSPDPEDFCIIVDLEVEVKGRTFTYSNAASQDNIVVRAVENTNGQTVSFMKGSRVYTNADKTEYINSLTTNYTDSTLLDIQNDSPAECFGIRSIDISYTNFMVPEVTIQFVDVRGLSLFAQEEMRHNVVKQGISSQANNSIEGSFFKSFFTFPYPKFTLRVKGFYGQMVSYELTCSDFRAAFQSESGNFNVTAKFVGYSFSFLNDVMASMMLAAPYSEYKGKQFWNDKVADGSFTVVGKNGQNVAMTKLGEICKQFVDIKNKVQQEINKEGEAAAAEKYKDQCGFSEETIEALKSKSVTQFKNNYDTAMSDLNSKLPKNSEDGQTYVVRAGNSICVFANEDANKDTLSDLIGTFNEKFKAMKEDEPATRNPQIRKWIDDGHRFELKHPGDYNSIVVDGRANENGSSEINPSIVQDKNLRDEIKRIAETKVKQANGQKKKGSKENDTSPSYATMWLYWDNSEVFIYEDLGLKEILDEATAAATQTEQESKEVMDKLSTQIQREKFSDAFDFDPTVENITKIIMAHFVTYINLIGSCAKNIISTGTKRKPDTINVSLDDFDDTPKDVPIPPFPSVTKLVTDNDGNEKREDSWIGYYGTADVFEEISLVEGLLTGIYNVGREISYGSGANGSDGSDGSSVTTKCGVYNPTSIADLAIESNSESPFGKPDFTDANSIFAHIAMRGYVTLCNKIADTKFAFKDLAKWDAENFMDNFQANEDFTKLKNALSGDLTGDKLYSYLSTGKLEDAPNPSAKSNPWKTNGGLFLNGSANKEYICASVGRIEPNKKGGLFPLKDWTFDELISSGGGNKGTLTNGSLSHFMGSPCENERTLSQYKNVWLFDKKVDYITKSTENIYIFKDYQFDADAFKKEFFGTPYTSNPTLSEQPTALNCFKVYGTNTDYNKSIGGEVIEYNENGSVSNATSLNKTFWDVFYPMDGEYKYYSYSKQFHLQAWYFLKKGFEFLHDDANWQKYYSMLCDKKTKIIYMPKFLSLFLGGYLWINRDNKNVAKPRPRTMQMLIDNFISWANSSFKKIKNVYEPKFKSGQSLESYKKLCKDINAVYSKEDVKDAFLNNLTKEYVTIFNQNCVIDGKRYSSIPAIYNNSTTAMQETLGELLSVTTVLIGTQSNNLETQAIWALGSELKSYLNHMVDELRAKLGVATDSQTPNSDSVYGSLNLDPDDMKVGVYNYLKMLYDKWVASDIDCTEHTMEKMFTSSEPKFYFVDSIYNKIGQSYYINIGTLVDMLVQSQSANGYSMLSMMADLYSSNKMLFLCLQNFADLANDNMMEKMFKPVPYLEYEEPKNHPNFVVVYPGEASSKLDIDGSDYPDDGFYLNEESTGWPEMIRNKKGDGMPIPAFGVSYGQQYQSYFTNVQVDMNSPIATEQSIKAKFMLCGGSTNTENDGPRQITVGQDLYAIYSNNSYTCTVTMLGCAWVQPMMYFVLLNVPMFRGSYQIIRVSHQIQAGKMVTTFTGVRMANTYTRAVKQYIYGSNNDPSDGTSLEQLESESANIDNDCDWAYYSPLGGGVDGKIVKDPKAKALEQDFTVVNPKCSARVKNPTGMKNNETGQYYEYNTWIDGFTASATLMLKHCTGKKPLSCPNNPTVLDLVCSWVDGKLYSNLSAQRQGELTKEAKNRADWAGMAPNVKFSITLDILTRLTASFAHFETRYHKRAEVEEGCRRAWKAYFEGSTPPSSITAKKGTVKYMQEYASGFTQSIQSTLNASNAYKSSKVTGSYDCHETYATVELKATGGDNPNNAMFDAIQNQYSQHWKTLSWNIGAGNADGNACSIVVTIVDSEPTEHSIRVIKNYKLKGNEDVVKLSTEKDVNEKFKLSMIKHFKKNNIKSTEAAKTRCTSLASMADDTVRKLFEIANTGDSAVQDCSSVLGGSMTGGAGNASESGGIIHPTTTAIIGGDFQCGAACEAAYQYTISFKNQTQNYDNKGHSMCVTGVMKAILAGFAKDHKGDPNPWNVAHKANWWLHELPKRGWVMIKNIERFDPAYRHTNEARNYFKTKEGYEPREGDIMLVNAPEVSTGNGSGSHAQIFLGNHWISDFIQKSNWVVYNTRSHVQIFRYTGGWKWKA